MSNQNQKELIADLKYWVGFSLLGIIGPTRFKKLYNCFPQLAQAWQASLAELKNCGLEESVIEQIILKRKNVDVDREMEKLNHERINVINIFSEQYPKLLKEIYDPPAILYFKGEWQPKQDEFSLAVVGTRKLSNYGQQVTPPIVRELTQAGLVIVSGLALGVDALAHESCLNVGGRTLAVLAGGLDRQSIYPSYNRYLAEKIVAQGGMLISEYPLGAPSLKTNFPQRNRIVSGLCRGVLVVEAPESSGALLTAKNALDQNREVFAVPGSIFNENSQGPNNLIKMGAKLVISAIDVLEALDLGLVKEFIAAKKIVPDSPEEAEILQHLSHDPLHVDQLVRLTNLDTKIINSTLTLMEMKGQIKNLGGMRYVISN